MQRGRNGKGKKKKKNTKKIHRKAMGKKGNVDQSKYRRNSLRIRYNRETSMSEGERKRVREMTSKINARMLENASNQQYKSTERKEREEKLEEPIVKSKNQETNNEESTATLCQLRDADGFSHAEHSFRRKGNVQTKYNMKARRKAMTRLKKRETFLKARIANNKKSTGLKEMQISASNVKRRRKEIVHRI